jgi:Protein of unknown function DUF262/Protein of unknown function (DUF1524)
MPIKETLTAKPATLADVLSNGKRYEVPPFQRDYAWEEDEWAELWTDIVEVHNAPPESTHYLGALVLQPTSASSFKIIDGQQRLVTLSVLALAVIGRISRLAEASTVQEAENNRERVRLLRERFVSTKDPASLQYKSRLRLNKNDDPIYQNYLIQGLQPTRPSALRGSVDRLYKAFLYFEKKVTSLFGVDASGEDLANFINISVAPRLKFIEIVVENDETAFTVFETLNSRGVALGTADLLKNFVFAVSDKGGADDLAHARMWWDQIVELVPLDNVATFLFHKLSTTTPGMREKRVFSVVKALVPNQLNVFEFLRQTKEAAEIYAALDDPRGDFWADFPESRRHVQVLELLRVQQCRPVILAALPRLADRPEKLAKLLWNLVVVSLRASIGRLNTGDLQRAYQEVAVKIEQGELKSPIAIARGLHAVSVSDDDFRTSFGQLVLDPKGPRKRLVRYLFSELEFAYGGQRSDFDVSDATIEHILPENAGAGWDTFSHEDRQRDVRRLGNLTLLEHQLNKMLGNSEYSRKRDTYAASRYHVTKSIEQVEWNPSTVRARQAIMAEKACAIWRIEDVEG